MSDYTYIARLVRQVSEELARRQSSQPNTEMRHAIRYALTAIDEHLAGTRIDWDDVRDVLRRAIGEKAGQ